MSVPIDRAALSAVIEATHGVRMPDDMLVDAAAEVARLAAAAAPALRELALEDEAAGFIAALDMLADDGDSDGHRDGGA